MSSRVHLKVHVVENPPRICFVLMLFFFDIYPFLSHIFGKIPKESSMQFCNLDFCDVTKGSDITVIPLCLLSQCQHPKSD